jgi:hypothetical protein
MGYTRQWTYLRVPRPDKRAYRILTVPRSVLKRGMSSATLVEADVDNIRHTPELGWTADVEITSVIKRRDAPRT